MRPPIPPQRSPLAGGTVEVSVEQDARVAAAVHFVEGMYRNPKPPRPRGPRGEASAGMIAVTSASIGPGTATTPTSGTVTFRAWDGTTLSAGSATATALNYHDKTIAAGSLVFLAWALGAWWVVDVRSCGNLS